MLAEHAAARPLILYLVLLAMTQVGLCVSKACCQAGSTAPCQQMLETEQEITGTLTKGDPFVAARSIERPCLAPSTRTCVQPTRSQHRALQLSHWNVLLYLVTGVVSVKGVV